MSASLEFLLGLLEQDEPPYVASEDLDGEHGPALRTWQALGFLSDEPAINPRASCPHCDGGVPYRLDERYVCAACRSVVDRKHLLLWRVDRDAFLQWLAAQLNLRGGVRRIEERLWQLGTWEADGEVLECFYRNGGVLAEVGRMRLSAYRRTLVFYGLSVPPKTERFAGPCVSLLELLKLKESLAVTDLRPLLRVRGNVRFDDQSGVLWVGDESVGEVPVGSKDPSKIYSVKSPIWCRLSGTSRKGCDNGHGIGGSRLWLCSLSGGRTSATRRSSATQFVAEPVG